jgi:hypothetical protein
MRHSILRHAMLASAVFMQAPDSAGSDATGTDASTTEITIQGLPFSVDLPYKAGAVTLSEGEANALNQTRAENLRNNFAPKVRKAIEEYRKTNNLAENAEVPVTALDHDALIAEFEAYAKDYEFSTRAGGGGSRVPTDPVGREAYRIAWDKIKVALTKQNIKIDSVSKEKKDELIKAAIAKYPAITEEAKRRVDSAADIALDDLGADTTQAAA